MSMEREIRKPKQKRALEKIDRILNAALKLFNEKGYFNTTTADIAKEANVATGSLYAYFVDKKDIYIQLLEKISEDIFNATVPLYKEVKISDTKEDLMKLYKEMFRAVERSHNFSKLFHDEKQALSLTDADIREVVERNQKDTFKNIRNAMEKSGVVFNSEEEGELYVRYSCLISEDICHRVAYENNSEELKELYIDRAVDMLWALFEKVAVIKAK